jgi:outer membrane lipoprotein
MRWSQELGRLVAVGLVALAMLGCQHAISEPLRQQVDPRLTFVQLQADPGAYKGRTVVLGGEIIRTHNTPEGTLLEVLQKPLNSYERPLVTDRTEGRFMVLCEKYLDTAVYTKGREVTVAGRVLGARTGQIGEIEYTYPLLDCLELHLWPQPVPALSGYAPYPGWYWYPWYWWDPWYRRPYRYPFWGPYYPYW